MKKSTTIYIVLLVLVIGFIIFIDASRPRAINWSPTYAVKDKIPFGLYVLDKEAPQLFKGQPIKKFSQTPYEYFEDLYDYDTNKYKVSGTLMAIQENSSIDSESLNELIYFAQHGNTIFLSMKSFPKRLLDTLKVETGYGFYYKDSIALYVDKPSGKKHYFAEGIGFTHFTSFDTLSTKVLGYQEIDTAKQANFIKVPCGNGGFLLHTQPAAFSNLHLLKRDHFKYAQDIASALPEGALYWNTGKLSGSGVSASPLRYILKQPALKWALYLSLITGLIFALFNAKRRQRIIPQIEPLRNTTVDFTKTIGNLYYQEGNHHTIIDKKIIYFLEKIRNEYLIDTYSLNNEFIEKLHLKIGTDIKDIENLVNLIQKHRHQFESTEADVLEINKAIEKIRL